ncbi:MFS general substrate transporter [Macrolepiota fuliginosa MF-IS2]|uniref:MFS general substrate transporter n=1 Tax=Macrolepiota fuliginosa MF-IS2 TaxID=1400762 RepID=A0A9P6C6A1_9AGAR|nr:MFS general substrate transporter [Macrolepiota fuliginosa MF-IS2]
MYSPTQIGRVKSSWIGGVQLCLVFSAGVFTGRLFDRGYFRHMMIAGTCLHAFSYFMLSLSKENKWYQVFLSHGVGSGLASGIAYIPCLCVVSRHFKRHRALAMGIVAAGTASGATVHPILLNHLFHTKIGFHNGVRISAGINSVCFILANLMMRTNQVSKPSTTSNVPLMKLFRDPAYGLMVVSAMLSNFGMFFPQFFIQLNAVLHGIDRNTAFYYLSVMNASSVLGRTLVPLMCPKIGVINVNIVFAFVMSINVLCLWAVSTEIGYILFSMSFGFVSGANVALVPPMIASLAKSVEEIGVRMGIAFASSGIVALFATPIAGALLTVNYNWGRPVLFAGICLMSSAALVVIARYFVVRRTGSQRV